jgi:DNA repair protein RadC
MVAEELGREELLSLMLSFVLPEERAAVVAPILLARFGSLSGILGASARHLASTIGGSEAASAFIKVLHCFLAQTLREPALDRPKISSSAALMDYLRMSMGGSQTELVRILFLDRKNGLIKDELHARGTVDHTPLYPREVVRRVLELDAKAIILVHNHPSGDPTPSPQDIEMTNLLAQVLTQIDVAFHDHVIVGAARTLSFRQEKLLR